MEMTYVQKMLLDFNSNIQNNSELIDYINQGNIFSTIGKARNEMVHTKMVADLLCGKYYVKGSESTLMHFLDIIIKRSIVQNKQIKQNLIETVLTRKLNIQTISDCRTEYVIKSYCFDLNRKVKSTRKDRLDLYIRLKLETILKKHTSKEIEIFIENKVEGTEGENQTQMYYDQCSNKQGEKRHQIFIYLTPISINELDSYDDLSKPNENFIWICYQDILNHIIEPLLDDEILGREQRILLNEYVRSLELPALPDFDDERYKNQKFKPLSIMATSTRERGLVSLFLKDSINKKAIKAAINAELRKQVYSYNGQEWLSYFEAIEQMLLSLRNRYSIKQILTLFEKVIDKGGSPFLIYVPDSTSKNIKFLPHNIYYYNKQYYKDEFSAIKNAIRDLFDNKGIEFAEFKELFSGVFKIKVDPMLSISAQDGYDSLIENQLYIRANISPLKYPSIEEVLKKQNLLISLIDDDQYVQLIQTNQYVPFLQDICKNAHYQRLAQTSFYFRIENESKLDVINEFLRHIDENEITLNERNENDEKLLKKFFESHSSLILTIYKIMIEQIVDNALYNKELRLYNKLLHAMAKS